MNKAKAKKESQDNIMLMMVSFFIDEMITSGISTGEEINYYFSNGSEINIYLMIKEYNEYQSITRSKAVKKVAELKQKIKKLEGDIMVSKNK